MMPQASSKNTQCENDKGLTSEEVSPYPLKLLPKKEFKLSIQTTDLPKDGFIMRQAMTPDMYDSEGELLLDAIVSSGSERDFYGLSCNLFSNYNISDLVYRVTDKELDKNWSHKVDCSIDSSQYTIVEANGQIFFQVKKLDGKTVPYKKNVTRKIEGKNVQCEADFVATCEVIHKPTLCNYWHFEIHFRDAETKLIKRSGSGDWQKNLASFLGKSFFLKAAVINVPPNMELAKEVYID